MEVWTGFAMDVCNLRKSKNFFELHSESEIIILCWNILILRLLEEVRGGYKFMNWEVQEFQEFDTSLNITLIIYSSFQIFYFYQIVKLCICFFFIFYTTFFLRDTGRCACLASDAFIYRQTYLQVQYNLISRLLEQVRRIYKFLN
jgi:hypothetical protein